MNVSEFGTWALLSGFDGEIARVYITVPVL